MSKPYSLWNEIKKEKGCIAILSIALLVLCGTLVFFSKLTYDQAVLTLILLVVLIKK